MMDRRHFLERLSGGLAAFVAAPRLLWSRWTEPTPVAQAPALPEPEPPEWNGELAWSQGVEDDMLAAEIVRVRSNMLYEDLRNPVPGRAPWPVRFAEWERRRRIGRAAHIEGDGWEARPRP